jgi:integral membrane protein
MLLLFRTIAVLEGISYLMLFGLTMPLKYLANMPEPNKFVGYAHGFLFIAYIILSIVFWMEKKWSLKKGAVILIASLLPFGTFYIDKKYLKHLK